MDYVIGLDIGTTHCKSVSLAMDGQLLQQSQSGYRTIQTVGGQSEQEAEVIFSVVLQLLQKNLSLSKSIFFLNSSENILLIFQLLPLQACSIFINSAGMIKR